jgi:hypothetical protein
MLVISLPSNLALQIIPYEEKKPWLLQEVKSWLGTSLMKIQPPPSISHQAQITPEIQTSLHQN